MSRPPFGRRARRWSILHDPLCWWYFIEDLVISPEDDADICANKFVVSLSSVVMIVFGLAWSGLFVYLQPVWACGLPFGTSLLGIIGMLHLHLTKNIVLARHLLCFGFCLCGMAIQWLLGGDISTMVAWSLLAPQMVLSAGGHIGVGCLFILLMTAIVAASIIVPLEYRLVPRPPMGFRCAAILSIVNFVIPVCISFLLAWFSLVRMRNQREVLEESLTVAQRVAQRIVNFDLDTIEVPKDLHNQVVVELLLQVANNLKLYRPHLPAHLITPVHDSNAEDLSSSCSPLLPGSASHQNEDGDGFTPIGSAPVPLSSLEANAMHSFRNLHSPKTAQQYESPPLSRVLSGFSSRLASGSFCSRPAILRAPSGILDVPHRRRHGTLLYIHLQGFDHLDKLEDEAAMEALGNSASAFVMAVTTALRETGGVVQLLQHNTCLASWNFISQCRLHAEYACRAAVAIKERLQVLQSEGQMLPAEVSMGVWCGSLVSGTFGTSDQKFAGVIGPGVKQVMALQDYAMTHGHCIVANAGIQEELEIIPRIRLLAIDVLAAEPCLSLRQADALVDSSTSEIIYEVLGLHHVVDSNEWMYELQSLEEVMCPEKIIEKLWMVVRQGVRDIEEFQQQLKFGLALEPAFQEVCAKLQRLSHLDSFAPPYQLRLLHTWVPVPFSLTLAQSTADVIPMVCVTNPETPGCPLPVEVQLPPLRGMRSISILCPTDLPSTPLEVWSRGSGATQIDPRRTSIVPQTSTLLTCPLDFGQESTIDADNGESSRL